VTNPFVPAGAPAPQGNPFGAPQHQQQYAPQHFTQPQPAGPAPMVAQPGAFATPPPPNLSEQGAKVSRPKLTDLTSRLVIIVPRIMERDRLSRFPDEETGLPKRETRLTADVIVLDGGVLVWGGQTPSEPRRQENPPYAIKGMWLNQRNLIEQCEPAHAAYVRGDAANGLALGRLWKAGTERNSPYVLQTPDANDVQIFNAYVQQNNPYAV
jgi:hypothetical protein